MIRSKTTPKEIVIDLTGPQGNAFFLLANATKLAKQLGLNPFKILDEMKEGDYEHLINTFDKYFGEYVVLER
tara:strand:- start:127 stop:342 length:216 start_codon:yes stop_codon:yes gene_type:complete